MPKGKGIRARVHGTPQLATKFEKLGQAVSGPQLVRALTSGALLVQNAAKERAPYLTGNLRRSIHIGGAEDLNPEGSNVIDKGPQPVPPPVVTDQGARVYVGTDVEYGAVVEYGGEGRAAQPYLRPAADTQAAAIRQEIGDALRDLLKAAL